MQGTVPRATLSKSAHDAGRTSASLNRYQAFHASWKT